MLGSISKPKVGPHGLHGESDINPYRNWEQINKMTTWRSAEYLLKSLDLPLEKRDQAEGFDVVVEIYKSPEGKIRAWCEYCQTDVCPHIYEAVQGALKSLVLNFYEGKTGDFREAIRLVKQLTHRDKERILKKIGIDTEDLNLYLDEIWEKGKDELFKKYAGSNIFSWIFYLHF